MLLLMGGFYLALLVVGGLVSLFVMFEPLAAHSATFPFAAFFAGLMACWLAIISLIFSGYVGEPAGIIIVVIAPMVGVFGGGVFGYHLGRGYRHRRRDTDDDA